MRHADVAPDVDALSREVIGAAIEVHTQLGPGLLERMYEEALAYELAAIGLSCESQVQIRVPYKSVMLSAQRLDLIVENTLIVEVKAVSRTTEIDAAQVLSYLSYLRCTGKPLGLLLNFHVMQLRDGIRRVVNSKHPALRPSHSPRPSRSTQSSYGERL
ncbi:MAG: GxxExxY protein [Phycisphaerales bacterium]|nr:GxxExxY protein [Phycisphaerales bacterium]